MKHVVNGQWSCSKEGACCELFAEFTLGTKPCPQLKEDKSCGCYETRPKVCRVSGIEIAGLDKNEYMIARCHLFHKIDEWYKDIGMNNSTHWILDRIAKSGIL
jgi:Fe-S-cluster containining protein